MYIGRAEHYPAIRDLMTAEHDANHTKLDADIMIS